MAHMVRRAGGGGLVVTSRGALINRIKADSWSMDHQVYPDPSNLTPHLLVSYTTPEHVCRAIGL